MQQAWVVEVNMRRIGLCACVVLALLLFATGWAGAQSIDIFGDSSASTCNITWPPPQPPFASFAYLYLAVLPGSLPGFQAVEFRVTGLPATPIPPTTEFFNDAAVVIGTSIADGLIVGWNTCQGDQASGPVLIGRVTLISLSPVGEHFLAVAGSLTPSDPNFACPRLNLCDSPAFTKVCVAAGQAFINSSSDCTVAVEERSWSAVKRLYRD